MAQMTKQLLSASTSGRGIKIAATATPGTVLHTVPKLAAADLDEVWIYVVNSSTVDRKLTIEFGGVTDPDNQIEFTVPGGADGLYLVIPGFLLDTLAVVRAFAAAADVIICFGYVHRIIA